jgi:hypothetical protein
MLFENTLYISFEPLEFNTAISVNIASLFVLFTTTMAVYLLGFVVSQNGNIIYYYHYRRHSSFHTGNIVRNSRLVCNLLLNECALYCERNHAGICSHLCLIFQQQIYINPSISRCTGCNKNKCINFNW